MIRKQFRASQRTTIETHTLETCAHRHKVTMSKKENILEGKTIRTFLLLIQTNL